MADGITLDWRRADGLTYRQRAICAMAERLTLTLLECTEPELDELRLHGLSDEDAWDVIEVAAMYNFTNRLALATGEMPNRSTTRSHAERPNVQPPAAGGRARRAAAQQSSVSRPHALFA